MYLLWSLLAGGVTGVVTAFASVQYIRRDERGRIAEKEARRRIVTGEIGLARLRAEVHRRRRGR